MNKFFNKNGSIRRQKIKSVTGVTTGGRKYTRFSQIKVKSPAKAGTRGRMRTGVGLAIL